LYLIAISKNLQFEYFLKDETLKRVRVSNLAIIGEATKQIPTDFEVKWNIIQWKNMAGMRDRLIHY